MAAAQQCSQNLGVVTTPDVAVALMIMSMILVPFPLAPIFNTDYYYCHPAVGRARECNVYTFPTLYVRVQRSAVECLRGAGGPLLSLGITGARGASPWHSFKKRPTQLRKEAMQQWTHQARFRGLSPSYPSTHADAPLTRCCTRQLCPRSLWALLLTSYIYMY